jgi:thioredoxin-like negative regulator of GroEL
VLTALATGCKSDAQQVCDKLASLAEQAGDADDKLAKKAAEEFEDADKCVAEVEKLQKEDPEVFADAKTCILDAEKIEDAVGCLFKAALDKKK